MDYYLTEFHYSWYDVANDNWILVGYALLPVFCDLVILYSIFEHVLTDFDQSWYEWSVSHESSHHDTHVLLSHCVMVQWYCIIFWKHSDGFSSSFRLLFNFNAYDLINTWRILWPALNGDVILPNAVISLREILVILGILFSLTWQISWQARQAPFSLVIINLMPVINKLIVGKLVRAMVYIKWVTFGKKCDDFCRNHAPFWVKSLQVHDVFNNFQTFLHVPSTTYSYIFCETFSTLIHV